MCVQRSDKSLLYYDTERIVSFRFEMVERSCDVSSVSFVSMVTLGGGLMSYDWKNYFFVWRNPLLMVQYSIYDLARRHCIAYIIHTSTESPESDRTNYQHAFLHGTLRISPKSQHLIISSMSV